MVDVITEVVVDRPLELVADYASDPDNAPEWYENIKSTEWKTPKPLRLGSQVVFVAHFLGRKLVYTYEIVRWIPEQIMIMRTAEGPFPMETTYTWTALDKNRTEMTLRNAGKPSGFSKLLAPFMSKQMKKANSKDLKNLKEIIEANYSI